MPGDRLSSRVPDRRAPRSHPLKVVAKPPQDRQHGQSAGEIVEFGGVFALVEQFLAPVAFIADVDEVSFGQRDERAAIGGRPTLVGIGRIG